jgi:predicted TIM-barrel fold metal-dependent hydrolase
MFETDFPHPTCLYPNPLGQAASGLATLDMDSRRKVLSGNAARLYRIPIV